MLITGTDTLQEHTTMSNFEYPDTQEKRRARMAAFRAKLLAAHTRLSTDPTLTPSEQKVQSEYVEQVKRIQKRFNEA